MKKIKNTLLLIAGAFVMSLAANPVYAGDAERQVFVAEKDTTTRGKVVCYEVFGMDCPGCQSALEKQMKKIDGVSEAKASWQKKQVVVKLNPDAEVKEEEITARIKKANFTPGEKLKPEKDEE